MSKSRRTSDLVNSLLVNADNSVNIHEGTQSPYFLLDTGAVVTPQQGMMFWDADRQTVGVQMNGVEARLGQDNFWYVKNQSGSDILKGTVVMAVGALGASSRILVAPMVADGSVEEQFLLGITAEDILNGEDGFVMNIGKIRGINTTQYGTQAGQVLYCDPAVPGGLTITQPQAPNLDIPIAFTVDYKSNGTLAVRTLPGYHLGELHDVQITTPVTNQILRYNNNRWENWTPTYLTSVPTLDQVTTAGNTTTNSITVGGLNSINKDIGTNLHLYTKPSFIQDGSSIVYAKNLSGQKGSFSGVVVDNVSGAFGGHFITSSASVYPDWLIGLSKNVGTWGDLFYMADSLAASVVLTLTKATKNVLIGTTTDSGYKLDVNGSTRVQGSLTVDTNTLFVDATNNRVGIGTASPDVKLTVQQSSSVYSQLETTNFDMALGIAANTNKISGLDFKNFNNIGQVRFMSRNDVNDYIALNSYGSNASGTLFGINRNNIHALFGQGATDSYKKLVIGTFNLGDLIFGTNNTERIRVFASTGNVGIGTTTDAGYKLDVNGTARIQSTLTANSFVKSGGTSAQFLKADGSVDSNTYLSSIPTLGAVTTAGNTTTNEITVKGITITNGTYPGKIINAGLNNYPNAIDLVMPTSGALRFGAVSFDGPAFQGFHGTAPSYTGQMYFDYGSQQRSVSGRGAFFRNASSTSPVTVMKLTESSNVLIGTTTDSGYKLNVNGVINSNAYFINGVAGWTGDIIIQGNPPGQQIIHVENGIITSFT